MSLPNEPADPLLNPGTPDPVQAGTGQNLKKWYDDFTKAPFVVLAFFSILAIIYQNGSLKSEYKAQIVKAELGEITAKREKFISDSTNESQKENLRYFWQTKYDKLDSNYKVLLVLFGGKKALENR